MRGIHNKWEDIMTNDRTGWPMRGLEELDEMYTWLAMLICNSDWIDFESKTKEPLCEGQTQIETPWIPWSQKDSFLLFSYLVEILFFYNDNDTCTSQKWHVLANCSEIIGHVQTPIYQNIRACVFVVKSLVKTCKLYW